MRSWTTAARRFLRGDSGTASVLPIFMLVGILLAGGISIDTGNLWRYGTLLRVTADVAAHSGIVALSRSGDPDTAAVLTQRAIEFNMPVQGYGPVIANAARDIKVWHYDDATNQLTADGIPNAVSVHLQRNADVANPVPMYLLQFFGMPDWSFGLTSVAALVDTRACSNAEGIFAQGKLRLTDADAIGAGFCLHSQTAVSLDRHTAFAPGSGLSMPDLADCSGFCDGSAVRSASREVNLIPTPLQSRIARLALGFADPAMDLPEKADFFATRPMTRDLSPLEEMMIDTIGLRTGSVIGITASDFQILREVPQGLVYLVACDPKDPANSVLDLQGPETAPPLHNVAVVTNCPIRFEGGVEVTGSVLITTYLGKDPALRPALDATIGDLTATCDPSGQSAILAVGDAILPPAFLASNVGLAIDGNVVLLGSHDNSVVPHHGASLHASGSVEVRGRHAFTACAQASISVLPALQVIRYVLPAVPIDTRPPIANPKLPGTSPDRLDSTPTLPRARLSDGPLLSQDTTVPLQTGL